MDQLTEGVRNLVQQCAEVKDGDEVLILNEYGKVDEEIAKLIAETVKATGAAYHVMWGESVERSAKALPKILIGAILSSAKIISNFSLNRALLDEYTRGKAIVQINNVARTVNLMASNHARYHWGMVRAIYSRLETIFSAAHKWQITSPAGTEIGGEIGSGSEVADAYFAEEAGHQDSSGSFLAKCIRRSVRKALMERSWWNISTCEIVNPGRRPSRSRFVITNSPRSRAEAGLNNSRRSWKRM